MESRGYKIYSSSKKKWRQVYDNKKDMRVLYNGWERWITTTGADIKIRDGSKKHSKQLWDHGVKMFHNLPRWGRSRMMKRRGGLKVGIQWIGELVDIVR